MLRNVLRDKTNMVSKVGVICLIPIQYTIFVLEGYVILDADIRKRKFLILICPCKYSTSFSSIRHLSETSL